MNATRGATNRIKLLGITEEDFRTALNLTPDHRIGASDVTDFEAQKADDLVAPNAAWEDVNFPVALREMSFAGQRAGAGPIPGRRALVRTDTDEVLNVVSDKYKLVPHQDVLLPVAQALQEMGLAVESEQADVSQNGAYIMYTWILADNPVDVAKGDRVHWAITLRNSYNYEAPLEFSFGAYRLICSNGLRIPAEQGESISGGKHRQGLDVEHALFELRNFLAMRADTLKRWKDWDSQKITAENFDTVLDGFKELSKAARAEIALRFATNGKRLTLWTAYNAMTWYITHQVSTTADRDALVRHTLHTRALRAMGAAERLAA